MTLIAFKLKERGHGSNVCVKTTSAVIRINEHSSLDLFKKEREDVIHQQFEEVSFWFRCGLSVT